MNKGNQSKYLLIFFLTFAIAFSSIIVINAIADPEGRIGLVDRMGFNAVKTVPFYRTRVAKALNLANCSYRYIIFGNSRADTGIPTDYKGFVEGPVYNAGLPVVGIKELRSVIRYAVNHQESPELIVGLDDGSFMNKGDFNMDYKDSRFAESASISSYLIHLLSKETLYSSYVTVRDNLGGANDRCWHTGMEDLRSVPINQRQAFSEVLLRVASAIYYGRNTSTVARAEVFADTMRFLAQRNIKAHFFISPIHAQQLIIRDEIGGLEQFFRWKKDLVDAMESVNRELPPSQHFSLWDFSGVTSITTEVLPEDAAVQMLYWRDANHYRPLAGEMILDRLLETNASGHVIPEGFGTKLTSENLQENFDQTIIGLEKYRLEQPESVDFVRNIIEQSPWWEEFSRANKSPKGAIKPPASGKI